jgi:hypothetical protein
MDLHNMDASTVAQMMHKMNPQMLAHLGGQSGLEQMMAEMEKEEKKIKVAPPPLTAHTNPALSDRRVALRDRRSYLSRVQKK